MTTTLVLVVGVPIILAVALHADRRANARKRDELARRRALHLSVLPPRAPLPPSIPPRNPQ